MDLKESIERRKSIRAFQKTAIPREVLEDIFRVAMRSPSWGNTQPSKITVVGGEVLQAMIRDFLQKVSSGEPSQTDLPFPKDWPEEQGRFYRENGKRLLAFLNIGREDKDRRNAHYLNMFRFFGAPQAIYIHMDKRLGPYSIFDAGLLAENIALLALEKGLGTCFLAMSVNYLNVVRLHTAIPESDQILMGMAIGYPDEGAVINEFCSERQPLENFVRWLS